MKLLQYIDVFHGDYRITPLFALTSRSFWLQLMKNTTLRPCPKLVRPPRVRWRSQRSVFRICDS